MKKFSAILLIGVLASALLVACGKKSEEVDFNTVDNNTSEEYVDPETGANLKDTIEEETEEPGIVPEDEYEGEPTEEIIVEDPTPLETEDIVPEEETPSETESTEEGTDF